MIYKVTLLKDTPDLKAGAMWVYFTENGKPDFANQIDPKTFEVLYDEELMPNGILNDPEWAKVEPFYEKLDDLRCPLCGETRGHLMVWPFSYTDSDGDALPPVRRWNTPAGTSECCRKGGKGSHE